MRPIAGQVVLHCVLWRVGPIVKLELIAVNPGSSSIGSLATAASTPGSDTGKPMGKRRQL
jgi:hypothetical protein